MSGSLVLRSAVPGDWHAVAALLDDNRLPPDGARAHLDTFVVATQDSAVVGCIGMEIFGATALLRSAAVAPLLQGDGIGNMLVEAIVQSARARGVGAVYLLTLTAAGYFARHGFAPVRRDQAPHELQASEEFRGACPASAALLYRDLRAAAAGPGKPD